MQTTIIVDCPLFEGVRLAYNMMASETEMNDFGKSLGSENEGVVTVEGWPHPFDPFGEESPMAFRLWAAKPGLQEATRRFLADPNF